MIFLKYTKFILMNIMKTHPKMIVAVAMLIGLLGTIGIALPYPVLAPYFIDYPANELTHFMGFHPKVLLGIALAVYPLGLLIGSIFIGALSDTYGRKKILLITLIGSSIGYSITAWSIYEESYLGFLTSRILTGICEGNISIARAIAAELHPKIDRARSISLVYAATYAGWLIGPAIGGFLMEYGVAEVFLFAAIGMILSLLLVLFLIQKDNLEVTDDKNLWHLIRKNNSLTLLKHREIMPIFWFYFLYTLGLNAFYDFYPIWFVDYFQADGKTISMATICLTIVMISVSAFGVSIAEKKWGEIPTLLIGSGLLALLLLIQPFMNLQYSFVIFLFIGGAIALANGMVPTYLSNHFGHLGQGKVMGLQTSTFCITSVLIATVGGPLSVLDSVIVLLIGAVFVLMSALLLWSKKASQMKLVRS